MIEKYLVDGRTFNVHPSQKKKAFLKKNILMLFFKQNQ